MPIDENLVRSYDLLPVVVTETLEDVNHLVFDGDLEEFLKAVAHSGQKVILKYIKYFDEEELSTDPSFDDDELTAPNKIDPSLKQFAKYIGQISSSYLSANLAGKQVHYVLHESWYEEFQEKLDQITAELHERFIESRLIEQEKSAQKLELILKKIRALLDLDNFKALKTQKAMLAYAYDAIPEIDQVNEADLKREISKLAATLQARGQRK